MDDRVVKLLEAVKGMETGMRQGIAHAQTIGQVYKGIIGTFSTCV